MSNLFINKSNLFNIAKYAKNVLKYNKSQALKYAWQEVKKPKNQAFEQLNRIAKKFNSTNINIKVLEKYNTKSNDWIFNFYFKIESKFNSIEIKFNSLNDIESKLNKAVSKLEKNLELDMQKFGENKFYSRLKDQYSYNNFLRQQAVKLGLNSIKDMFFKNYANENDNELFYFQDRNGKNFLLKLYKDTIFDFEFYGNKE